MHTHARTHAHTHTLACTSFNAIIHAYCSWSHNSIPLNPCGADACIRRNVRGCVLYVQLTLEYMYHTTHRDMCCTCRCEEHTLWVHHCAGTVLPSTPQGQEASEGDRVTSEVGWVNPHSESWGCLVNRSLIKYSLIREKEFSIHSPAGCGNSVPRLSIHPLHHIRVVADEVNSVVVTGSGVVGGEEHSLGSTWVTEATVWAYLAIAWWASYNDSVHSKWLLHLDRLTMYWVYSTYWNTTYGCHGYR